MSSSFKPCVVIICGADLGKKFDLEGVSTIGRHSTCDVKLDDAVVSRFHAEIEQTKDGWLIRDLNSANCTFVNDVEVQGDEVLPDRATIRTGRTIMKFLSDEPEVDLDQERVHITTTDGLTGIWNKRSFIGQVGNALAEGETVSVAMLDLVDFKDVNDYNGFLVGDMALRDFGQLLRSVVGHDGEVGRIGGEEFAIWTKGNEEAVQDLAMRIKRQMYIREFGAQDKVQLQIWMGSAQSQTGQKDIELVAAADQDLETKRTQTRGRVNVTETLSQFVLFSNHPDELFELPFGEPRMGRSSSCEIVLKSARIAKSHARLIVSSDGVEVVDHNSTNGVYVNGVRMKAERFGGIGQKVRLKLGDVFHIGEFSFELALAPWLVVEPPGDLIVTPDPDVETSWNGRYVPQQWNDELWAAYYLRWRKLVVETLCRGEPVNEDEWQWPITAIGTMCSPPVIQWVRDLLIEEDNRFWFLGYRNLFIDALVNADHGIGPLSAFKIMQEHPDPAAKQRATEGLANLANQDGHKNLATAVLDRVPKDATSIAALVLPLFEHARNCEETWRTETFMDYMSRPSFAEAAENIVFSIWSSGGLVDNFRPSEGALLTIEDARDLQLGQYVSVAESKHLTPQAVQAWEEHLADFEIIQPFNQFE